ncbi:MAG: NADH-quinone oxidoreductase subunit C [Campylobacterales bacterium]
MDKIPTTPDTLLDTIRTFYTPSRWHFITITGVDQGEKIELIYSFSEIGEMESYRHLALTLPYDQTLPTITPLIPSAWIAEAELVDLFGLSVSGAKGGLFLDEDGVKAPLRGSK